MSKVSTKGLIWFSKSISILERELNDCRLSFLTKKIQDTINQEYLARGYGNAPKVKPEMLIYKGLELGIISESAANEILMWHRKEVYKASKNTPEYTKLRQIVLKRDGNLCQYCGYQATAVDHIIPRSKGGKDSFTNLLAVCNECNSTKSNKDFDVETIKVIQWLIVKEKTVSNGYGYLMLLVEDFFNQLESKSPFRQAQIRDAIGIKRSKLIRSMRNK